MSALVVQQSSGLRGLRHLFDDWLELLNCIEDRAFNQHPAWYLAYFQRSANAVDPLDFITVRRGGELVAVFPVFAQAGRWIRRSALARDQGLHTSDCAIADQEDKRTVWRAVCNAARRGRKPGWDVFYVADTGVLETSHMARCLHPADAATFSQVKPYRCMVIDVLPYNESIAGLTSKFRNNLKRSKRRLREMGNFDLQWITRAEQIDAAFDEFLQLEMSGWKGDPGAAKDGYPEPSAIALQDWKLRFYRRVMREFANHGGVEIVLLQAAGRTVGAQVYLSLNRSSYMLKTAMEGGLKGVAPGHVMIDAALARYAEQGRVREINLMSDYSWHEPWNPRTLNYISFNHYNRSLAGFLSARRRALLTGI